MFKIVYLNGHGYCDVCGNYNYTRLRIYNRGEELCDESDDVHAGKTNDYDIEEKEGILRYIVDMLNKAGFPAELEIKEDD